MAEVIITSEAFVKTVMSISDNLNAKYLRPAIREAQEVHYKGIVGAALLTKIKTLIAAGELADSGNEIYKELVDNSQYFLAYQAAVEVLNKVAYKVANVGVVKTADQNIYNASQDEIAKQMDIYTGKADFHRYELQGWLLDNAASLPELGENTCKAIRANLRSAASCGVWLGGARGKGQAFCPCDINLGRRVR